MTTFETIIFVALYFFAFGYTINSIDLLDKRKTWMTTICVGIIAATIGIICFPMILGNDIWEKLNKEKDESN